MPRALAILLLLCTSSVFAGPMPEWLRGAGADPRWPSLSRGREHSLPPAGLASAQDRQGDAGISPGEAARRAQQMNNGGRVLSVEPASGGWRVKLIKQGDVRIVFVPD